ncbi:MAG: hypothetical protein EG826_04390 [Deltaproteobacteria bacterium]|nr:hypothetical protein [Deltaproteobacteria bacterium]
MIVLIAAFIVVYAVGIIWGIGIDRLIIHYRRKKHMLAVMQKARILDRLNAYWNQGPCRGRSLHAWRVNR